LFLRRARVKVKSLEGFLKGQMMEAKTFFANSSKQKMALEKELTSLRAAIAKTDKGYSVAVSNYGVRGRGGGCRRPSI